MIYFVCVGSRGSYLLAYGHPGCVVVSVVYVLSAGCSLRALLSTTDGRQLLARPPARHVLELAPRLTLANATQNCQAHLLKTPTTHILHSLAHFLCLFCPVQTTLGGWFAIW